MFKYSPTPGMDPGVRSHGMKAKIKVYLRYKYDCFQISGCQNMDFQNTLTQKYHFLKVH